jgi:hypothetical protein
VQLIELERSLAVLESTEPLKPEATERPKVLIGTSVPPKALQLLDACAHGRPSTAMFFGGRAVSYVFLEPEENRLVELSWEPRLLRRPTQLTELLP